MDERIRTFLDANPSERLYHHQPLEKENHFRVVHLAAGEQDEDIVLKVSNHCIEDAPPYEALSYTWGEKVTIEYVRCNDHDMAVTTSLIEALKQFRYHDKPRTLWIDQCSIDQSDVDERSQQVNMMRRIYASASCVLSWLGPATANEGALLRKILQQLHQAIDISATEGEEAIRQGTGVGGFPVDETLDGSKRIYMTTDNRAFYPSDEWLIRHGLPTAAQREWDAFDEFLNNAYFERRWIIQEVKVNGNTVLRWGSTEIPWVSIHNAVRYCIVNGTMQRPGHNTGKWVRYLTPFASPGDRSLTSLLTMTKLHKCADMRDRIFALIGVSNGLTESATTRNVSISADYSLKWEEIFRDTIRTICRHSRRLEILTAFQHEPIPPTKECPSWAGQWESQAIFTDFTRRASAASGETLPELSDHTDKNVLPAKGVLVDTVVAVNEPFFMSELPGGEVGALEGDVFENAWTLIRSSRVQKPRDIDQLELLGLDPYIRALAETLLCNATFFQTESDARQARSKIMLAFATHQLVMASMAIVGQKLSETSASLEVFWPESGILAALTACKDLNPSISINDLEVATAIPREDLFKCQLLEARLFSHLSTDVRLDKLKKLIAATRVVDEYKSQLHPGGWRAFAYSATNLRNQRFFVTSSGNIGIGPHSTTPGDQICILYGGPVPYIVREIAEDQRGNTAGDEHWFLGGCYLHNMMEGQAIQGEQRETYTEKTFMFR